MVAVSSPQFVSNAGYQQPCHMARKSSAPETASFQTVSVRDGTSEKRTWNFLMAVGLYALAAASHRLPLKPRLPGDGLKTILPSDWKVWARVLLGIGAVHKLNQAMDWHLPPWLGALETMAVVNPLVTAFEAKALLQTAVMAPLVMGVVQGASFLDLKLEKPAKAQYNIPPLVTQVGLTALAGLGAMLVYPVFYKQIAKTGILGKALKQEAAHSASTFASASFANCIRGCSPGSFICLSELADVGGSISVWLKEHLTGQKPDPKSGQKNISMQPDFSLNKPSRQRP